MLFSFLEKKIRSGRTPSPNFSGLSSQNSLIRAIEVKTGLAFRQPPLKRRTLSCTPQVHNIEFKPALIADYDAFVGQIIGGAVSPFSADKAGHATT